MAEVAIFTCSICCEPSGEICVFCTKDACINHRCDRCKRCSDCCECEIPLSAAAPEVVVVEPPREPETQPLAESMQAPTPMEPPVEPEMEPLLESEEPLAATPQPDPGLESDHEPEPGSDLQPPHPEHPIF
jgi:hypothetical protein